MRLILVWHARQSMLLHCNGGVAVPKRAIACQSYDLMYEPDSVRNIARTAYCSTESPIVRLLLASIQLRARTAKHTIQNLYSELHVGPWYPTRVVAGGRSWLHT